MEMRTITQKVITRALLHAEFVAPGRFPIGTGDDWFSVTFLEDVFAYRFIVGLASVLGPVAAIDVIFQTVRIQRGPNEIEVRFLGWNLERAER